MIVVLVGFPVTVTYFLFSTQYFCSMNAVMEGMRSTTERACPARQVVHARYLKVGLDGKRGEVAPASTSGFPKSASDSMKITRSALAMPGSASGSVTFPKTCSLDDPRSSAASSRVG